MRLSGKVALITGAARGIGRACALRFAEHGADVVLTDICADLPGVPYPLGTESQLHHSAELCRETGASVLALKLDVRSLNEAQRVADLATERFGSLDVLVNNAGIAAPSGKIAHQIEEQEWQLMLDVDLSGAWRMIKAVAAGMATRRRGGSIINVCSTAGVVGYRHFSGYVAAKHGLLGLTRAAALDYASLQIRVNAVLPGSVRDDPVLEGRMLAEVGRCLEIAPVERERTFVAAQPMNALIEPNDVAMAALWLASDESRQVTGAAITIDGGFSIQ